MFDAVRANAPVDEQGLEELLSVDSSSVRAHQHAAGAPAGQGTGG
jgi:putative transposase